MAETVDYWQARIDEVDAAMAEISSTGAASVSGFGRSVNSVTLAELQRQRAFYVARLNLLVNPSSMFGSVTIT